MNCYAISIDSDKTCSLDLFRTEAERDAFMWNYAFDNSGTDATTLEEFKAECDDDLGEAMERTNDGYLTDEMVQAEDDRSNVFTFLDLSTAHVSPDARRWLEAQALSGTVGRGAEHTVAAYAEGWFVWVPHDFGDEEPLKHYRDRIPADLNAPMMRAHKAGCYYVRFDADGDRDESLPVYEDDESSLDGFSPEAIAAIEAARANPDDAGIADELAEPAELETVRMANVAGKEVVDRAALKALIEAGTAVLAEFDAEIMERAIGRPADETKQWRDKAERFRKALGDLL
jgi:hypothetical protein